MRGSMWVALSATVIICCGNVPTSAEAQSRKIGAFDVEVDIDKFTDEKDISISTDDLAKSGEGVYLLFGCQGGIGTDPPHELAIYYNFGQYFAGRRNHVRFRYRIDKSPASGTLVGDQLTGSKGLVASFKDIEFFNGGASPLSNQKLTEDSSLFQALKNGQRIMIEAEDIADGETISHSFSLRGFAEAVSLLPCSPSYLRH